MLLTMIRINHVKEICDKKGWTRSKALREMMYHAEISKPTAIKIYEGGTDLSLDIIERVAAALQVAPERVLELRNH